MTDREARLAAFWAAGEPPARDPRFEAKTMDAIARQRLFDLTLEWFAPTIAMLAIAIALWPVAARAGLALIATLGLAAPILFAAAIVAGTIWVARQFDLIEMPEFRL